MIVGRFCETPWRLTQTPYNLVMGLPSSLVICHSSFTSDISRPDESSDQPVAGIFRFRVGAHGAGYPDATAKERGSGGGIWRRGHGKYLWRANDQRPGEVHHMAGRHFFRADICLVDP